MRTLLSIVTILCLCSVRVSALGTFPEKFVARQKSSNVTLSCEKATKDPVTWKLDGQDLEPEPGVIKMNGSAITLQDFDIDLIGNFSCWSAGKEVDYTYVLLDMSDTITGSLVSCTAETFNCSSNISCTMSEKGYDYFRLRDERNANGWLSPSENGKFYLTHTTNPFAEEATPIVVLGEAVSNLKHYLKTNYSFYIRDILKPGPPHVSVRKGSVLAVAPPDSWALPLSYYPLENEIEFQNRNDGTIKPLTYKHPNNTDSSTGNVTIPKGTSKLRARCRDSLLLSQWSEWSEWKNTFEVFHVKSCEHALSERWGLLVGLAIPHLDQVGKRSKRRPKNVKKQKKMDKKEKGIRPKSR